MDDLDAVREHIAQNRRNMEDSTSIDEATDIFLAWNAGRIDLAGLNTLLRELHDRIMGEGMEEARALKDFARWAITEGPFQGCDLDGGSVQDKAAELGLIVKVPFDPEKHDGPGAEYCEPGDDWYEFSAALNDEGE